ncbi:MAG TPA: di-heme oxidoredictase family protein [Kofleriaceae bacterium]|nr:di-heme oxidoredictase family protein [Kofleriaceae bacterium]
MRRTAVLSILTFAAAACGGDDGSEYEPGEEYAGGVGGTAFDATRTAFTHVAPALVGARRDAFFVGDSIFDRNWVTAPASTSGIDGLGPTFNARSCSSCHSLDGRGRPPEPGEPMLSSLVRLSVPGVAADGGPVGEPKYGGQLNPTGILGVPGEGTAELTWTEEPGTYDDGTPYSLRRPTLAFRDLAFGAMAADVMTSVRVAPQVAGLGLLELVPEADVRALADPDDVDGDGISGRANDVWDEAAGMARLGRLGWKANQPSMRQQSAGASLGDLGITSPLFPQQNCPPVQTACASAPDGDDPDGAELDGDKLDDLTYYGLTLAAPGRRHVQEPDVLAGKALFRDAGCASCHTPVMTTGTSSDLPELVGLTIRPYTDLLLHDMGPDLADGRPDFLADGTEWRTPPLWGVGLFQITSGHSLYLHDGRARGLAEAILWHGGEASTSRDAFRALSSSERAQLLTFLDSL